MLFPVEDSMPVCVYVHVSVCMLVHGFNFVSFVINFLWTKMLRNSFRTNASLTNSDCQKT